MSSASNRSLAPQSTGDTQHNVRDAALIGAGSAFAKPAPAPKPATNTYTGARNGALLAATRVGTGGQRPLSRETTGGSASSSTNRLAKSSSTSSSNTLGLPTSNVDRAPSPSNIAAKLAAARFSPRPPPSPAMSERSALQQPRRQPNGTAGTAGTDGTDDTPIPPTNALVSMFEQRRPTATSAPSVSSSTASSHRHVTQSPPVPLRSPKPQRAFQLPPESIDETALTKQRTATPPPLKPKPSVKALTKPPPSTDVAAPPQPHPVPKSPSVKQKPPQLAAINTKSPPRSISRPQGTSPETRRSNRRISTSIDSIKSPTSPASFVSAKEEQDEPVKPDQAKLKPAVPPPRRSTSQKAEPVASNKNSLRPSAPVPVPYQQNRTPSPFEPIERLSPPRRPTSSMSTPSGSVYHNNYQRASVKAITKHMTGESLSSAIMGAALASSRNSSPAPATRPMAIEPLFPPRKHHHHHSPFHRSPSPPKPSPPKNTGKLRTTMRKDPSLSDSEDETEKYKRKGTRIMGLKGRKHPNKHHEGTRKRWRDEITERERKRYEGVWAANRGLCLPTSGPRQHMPSPDRGPDQDDPSLDVLNLVVRDIWLRSRLPTHELEEVWDLVDNRGIGRLSRIEFVVGLWLIDQRLKGRKLPPRVSESVWTSARGLGIKVKVRG
jgi:hypothetical protein